MFKAQQLPAGQRPHLHIGTLQPTADGDGNDELAAATGAADDDDGSSGDDSPDTCRDQHWDLSANAEQVPSSNSAGAKKGKPRAVAQPSIAAVERQRALDEVAGQRRLEDELRQRYPHGVPKAELARLRARGITPPSVPTL